MTVTTRTVGGATASLTTTVDDLPVLAELSCTALTVPAGTYRMTTLLAATPSDVMPAPVAVTTTVTRASTGPITPPSATLRFHRPLDSAGTLRFGVVVAQQSGINYLPFASSYDGGQSGSIAVSQAPARQSPGPLFGANVQLFMPTLNPRSDLAGFLDRMLGKLAGSGVSLVRSSAPWPYMQTSPGVLNASTAAAVDLFADACAAHGLKWVLMTAGIAPGWAAKSGVVGAPPTSWSLYDTFVDLMLARYGTVIAGWSNGNEPNLPGNLLIGSPAAAPAGSRWTLADIIASQQHLYDRVRASAHTADITVLSPALSGADTSYLQILYTAGLSGLCDAVDIHPYNNRNDLGTFYGNNHVAGDPAVGWPDLAGDGSCLACGVNKIRNTMAVNGDTGLPVWVTEWGVATAMQGTVNGPTFSAWDVDEPTQAEWIATAVRQAARIPDVGAMCVYMLYDNNADTTQLNPHDITDWFANLGMTDSYGLRDKPSLAAFKGVCAGSPA